MLALLCPLLHLQERGLLLIFDAFVVAAEHGYEESDPGHEFNEDVRVEDDHFNHEPAGGLREQVTAGETVLEVDYLHIDIHGGRVTAPALKATLEDA
jgi:hypothetical protein